MLAAALLAGAFAVGPVVAWDMTTQPPRAEPRSPWPKASPWKTAGVQMKDSVEAMARVYLPATSVASTEPSPPAAPSPSALAVAAPTVTVSVRPAPGVGALGTIIAVE